MPFIS